MRWLHRRRGRSLRGLLLPQTPLPSAKGGGGGSGGRRRRRRYLSQELQEVGGTVAAAATAEAATCRYLSQGLQEAVGRIDTMLLLISNRLPEKMLQIWPSFMPNAEILRREGFGAEVAAQRCWEAGGLSAEILAQRFPSTSRVANEQE